MNNLPTAYREMILPHLPDRAFLRRDRGGALFITNAPRFADAESLIDQFQVRGFICTNIDGFLCISPGPAMLTEFELQHNPPDFFCETLIRFRGEPPSEAALRLFARGVQLLENADSGRTTEYLRQTRHLAALSLRNHQGGAYACALIAHTLETERSNMT